MKARLPRRVKLFSAVMAIVAALLVGGLDGPPSRSQDAPTLEPPPAPFPEGFRGVQPPLDFDPLLTPQAGVRSMTTPVPSPDIHRQSSQQSRMTNGEKIEIVGFGDTQALLAKVADGATEIIYLMPDEDQTPFIVLSTERIVFNRSIKIYGNGASFTGFENRNLSLIYIAPFIQVELHHIQITNSHNIALGGYGGAVVNEGNLLMYDSQVIANSAVAGGGGIMNSMGGGLYLERVTFESNQAGGGAGIQNDGGSSTTAVCSQFLSNSANYGAAILNGQSANHNGMVTVSYSIFDQNVANGTNGNADIHNVFFYNLMNAKNNWWGVDNNAEVSASVDITPALSDDPTASPYTIHPQCQPKLPRLVSEEAVPLHVYAEEFGLPMPFDRLPYNVRQPGQEYVAAGPGHDPLGWFRETELPSQITIPVQGFGPTYSAFLKLQQVYRYVFAIHSGIDYGGGLIWRHRPITSLCNGIIIQGNNITGTAPNGGSAAPGRGVSIRCFMDAPALSLDNPTGIQPRLSNIVVTYNHLLEQMTISCSMVPEIAECMQNYGLPQLNDVVRIGEVLGQTGGDPTLDHLHLTVHFARGFTRALHGYEDNTFQINPLFMYDISTAKQHIFQIYYADYGSGLYGIDDGHLTEWSGGAFNSAPYGQVTANSFWNVQNNFVSGVEWPRGYFPQNLSNDPSLFIEFMEYIPLSYSISPYNLPHNAPPIVPPVCNLSIDTNRTPNRLVGDCAAESDLSDETPYPDIAHPTPTTP